MRLKAWSCTSAVAPQPATANLLGKIGAVLVPRIDAAGRIFGADRRTAGHLLTPWVFQVRFEAASQTWAIPLGLLRLTKFACHRHAARIPALVAARWVDTTDSVATIGIAAPPAVVRHEALAIGWARIGRDADRGGNRHTTLVPRDLATIRLDTADRRGARIVATAPRRMNLKAVAAAAG